jgi:aerobic carbon-monoxide dehydrogenase medium subunit
MIPASFDYARPDSVDGALAALVGGGEDAKVIAGGQSLVPLLRLRLAYPSLLVDLGGVAELRGVRDDGDALVIGAMTTHHDVMTSPLVREYAGLLAAATGTVADPAVRHRGTFGGSLAHGDPAGDLPAVALAYGAQMVIAGAGGRRTVASADFFRDYLQTAVGPAEVLVEVRVPKLGAGWGFHYEKFHRAAQAWALVGVAALVQRSNGSIAHSPVSTRPQPPSPPRPPTRPKAPTRPRTCMRRRTTASTSRACSPVVPWPWRPGSDGRHEAGERVHRPGAPGAGLGRAHGRGAHRTLHARGHLRRVRG